MIFQGEIDDFRANFLIFLIDLIFFSTATEQNCGGCLKDYTTCLRHRIIFTQTLIFVACVFNHHFPFAKNVGFFWGKHILIFSKK